MLKSIYFDFFAGKITHHLTTKTTCTKNKTDEKKKMNIINGYEMKSCFVPQKKTLKKRTTRESNYKMHKLHYNGRLKAKHFR